MSPTLSSRPTDATLSVTKAARLLGVHPNTVRAWSDAGRLRYYRINPRGDRRYRVGDLQRFLAAAEGIHAGSGAPGAAGATPGAGHARRSTGSPPLPWAPSPGDDRHALDLSVIGTLARLTVSATDGDAILDQAATLLREAYGHHLVAVWELRGDRLVARAAVGGTDAIALDTPVGLGVLGRAIALATAPPSDARARVATAGLAVRGMADTGSSLVSDGRPEMAAAIAGAGRPWGVLHVVGDPSGVLGERDIDLVSAAADAIGALVGLARRESEVSQGLHRAEALRRVAGDIGARLDLDDILTGLVEHATVLFEADRAAVLVRRPDGRPAIEIGRGVSSAYLGAVRDVPAGSLERAAIAAGGPVASSTYRDDPRGAGVRAAVVQEGIDTMCSAPLIDGSDLVGILDIIHDAPHAWTEEELDAVATLAAQTAGAVRTAQHYQQMAVWAAQLQSIQHLGARLNRLSSVSEIGLAIATELRQLIDYQNAQVYRRSGDELIPVATSGQVGEYVGETPERPRARISRGITGWVAEHRIPQNLADAANDPRTATIPGSRDDLEESMLLAPMLFDDQVIGVLVLSKLGLAQFGDDDLRLLVIYASFAAQAMANADATERLRDQSAALERQLRSQRALLQITEAMLTTFDARAVLDSITERLGGLIACDTIAIDVLDPASGTLVPLTARGVHATHVLEPRQPGVAGVVTWVVEHNEPVLIADERADPRANDFDSEAVPDSLDGSLIVVPLRDRAGAIGVLTLERLGSGVTFSAEEFELVQLFAAQVSVALQNAEVFREIEDRARGDALTGLLNHGTFMERLERLCAERRPFSLIMLDLDDFREVNNALGHQAGDRLLREIAEALQASGRATDQVFRYGGDEFALVLPNADASRTMSVAERVRLAVSATTAPGTTWADDGVRISASIGMASHPEDGATAATVLLAADRALFVAKRSGRDRVATAAEGLALEAEFSIQDPTPVDQPTDVP